MKLGVNVDHVATVRQARRTDEPDPVKAAMLAELGGADSLVVHLREDRRHIQERDLRVLKETISTRLNLEMALDESIARIALEIRPDQVTFVPERRQEVTTESGLDLIKEHARVAEFTKLFKKQNILVSVFIDPDRDQLQKAKLLGVNMVELHTGYYANSAEPEKQRVAYHRVAEAAVMARNMRLGIAAGHGLTYQNVRDIAHISEIEELNIGHSIVGYAIMVGMERAVREMKQLITR